MLTLQGARDYVRSFLDTDEDEIPDSLLDVWIQEGLLRVQKFPWLLTFYEHAWNFSVTPGTGSYAFDLIADPDEVDEIISVEGPNWLLKAYPHEMMVQKYAWSTNQSNPIEYSIHARTLYFWEPPASNYAMVIRGYRKSRLPVAAADEFDAPEEFHILVAEWALARGYEQQDDFFMSQNKFQKFNEEIELLSRRWRRGPKGQALVVGAGFGPMFPNRLIWPWE